MSAYTWNAYGEKGRRRYELLVDGAAVGWYVLHCGHPTANFPYYCSRHPLGHGSVIIREGRKYAFRLLEEAKQYAIELWEKHQAPPERASTRQFTLENRQVKPKPRPLEAPPAGRQKVLFSGLDCLPGQLDLFPTDGEESGCKETS